MMQQDWHSADIIAVLKKRERLWRHREKLIAEAL
ncbi:Predicted transcriptional regulator [Escherichia coli]|nr:Predicted transcriptional regulator [Escherichia coli]